GTAPGAGVSWWGRSSSFCDGGGQLARSFAAGAEVGQVVIVAVAVVVGGRGAGGDVQSQRAPALSEIGDGECFRAGGDDAVAVLAAQRRVALAAGGFECRCTPLDHLGEQVQESIQL